MLRTLVGKKKLSELIIADTCGQIFKETAVEKAYEWKLNTYLELSFLIDCIYTIQFICI